MLTMGGGKPKDEDSADSEEILQVLSADSDDGSGKSSSSSGRIAVESGRLVVRRMLGMLTIFESGGPAVLYYI